MRRAHPPRRGAGAPPSAPVLILALAALLCLGLGCSSSNPVEPAPDPAGGGGSGGSGGGDGSGTYQINLSVTPMEVPVGGSGTLAVTVTNRNGGAAPANGSEVSLNTNLGYFSLNDKGQPDRSATVGLVGGAGQTPYFGGDSTGKAEIIAVFDDSTASLDITVSEPEAPPFFASGVSPDVGSGQGGQRVTVSGTGFTQPLQVTFGGAVGQVRSVAPDSIVVTTPPAVPALASGESRRVDVVVSIDVDTEAPRTSTLPGGYIYAAGGGSFNQPAIFSIAPTQGPNEGGTPVSVLGESFEADARVFFGFAGAGGAFDGVEATPDSSKTSTDTTLYVTTPPATGAGQALLNKTVDVQVENPRTGLTAVLLQAYRYGSGSGGGGILVSGISPRRAPYTGRDADGAVSVTLLGQGFGNAGNGNLRVSLAGVPQGTPTVKNASDLEVPELAAAPVANCSPPSGPAVITNVVTGESGQSDFDFTYTVDQPRINSLAPASAGPSGFDSGTVTLNGSAFQGSGVSDEAVRVTFDGVPGTGASADSSTRVTVTPPAFTGSFDTEPCDANADGVEGTIEVATAVDVVFTNQVNGCSATLVRGFTYEPEDPACQEATKLDARFSFSATGLTVQFSDLSAGSPVSWEWDFGDGGTSIAQNPSKTYAAAGSYTVTLKVTNAGGAEDQTSQQVTVDDP